MTVESGVVQTLGVQRSTTYRRIAEVIDYLQQNFKEQPSLDEVGRVANLSPFHLQRMFTEWAGVSPKKFIQYLSLDHAKQLLKQEQKTLLETAHATGLSGSGRLHDLFVRIEGMTPGEFKNGGEKLTINYCFADSPFGKLIVASTSKGICHLFFEEDEAQALSDLQCRFPNATYLERMNQWQQEALFIFQKDRRQLQGQTSVSGKKKLKQPEQLQQLQQIKLHLNGTPFQLKVWESLLSIPEGRLTSYGFLAEKLGNPKASRAVGSAIGSNPVAFLIPCHRVIQAGGNLGGYRWGTTRKSALIGWEAARLEGA